jgi:hypothetical protein
MRMPALSLACSSPHGHPLDIAEAVIAGREWTFERSAAEELALEIGGAWCNYRAWFSWQENSSALMFTVSLENKIPDASRERIYPLLARINEQVWLGHFDVCSEGGVISFRYGLLLRGTKLSVLQLEDLLDVAIAECERFYPAFQSVVWGGKSCEEALSIALFDTVGEA